MLDGLMKQIWNWLSPKVPDSQAILNKAMEAAHQNASPAAVMSVLEGIAQNRGKGDVLSNNQIWNSFKQKQPSEIVPHAQAILKETGKLPAVMSFFMNNGGNK